MIPDAGIGGQSMDWWMCIEIPASELSRMAPVKIQA